MSRYIQRRPWFSTGKMSMSNALVNRRNYTVHIAARWDFEDRVVLLTEGQEAVLGAVVLDRSTGSVKYLVGIGDDEWGAATP